MSRYIDADMLYVDWYDSFVADDGTEHDNIPLISKGQIDDAPSIDIEPKRGEWIDYTCGSGCYCSNCGWDGDDIIDECIIQDFDFCPNCGADMRGEDND